MINCHHSERFSSQPWIFTLIKRFHPSTIVHGPKAFLNTWFCQPKLPKCHFDHTIFVSKSKLTLFCWHLFRARTHMKGNPWVKTPNTRSLCICIIHTCLSQVYECRYLCTEWIPYLIFWSTMQNSSCVKCPKS